MQSILFITTSSLATNPRLVKEFEFLKKKFHCIVFCFEHDDWSKPISKSIMDRNKQVEFVVINRHQQIIATLVSKIIHRSARILNPLFKSSNWICAFASNDKTPQLFFKLFNLPKKQQLGRIVAHNLGSFFPATYLAQQKRQKLQLDIEDFHPGEALYFNKKQEQQNRLQIMQNSFDSADVITYASKGIQIACEKRFLIPKNTKRGVIINAFESDDFMKPMNSESSIIKCVWFSQNISPQRGLEQVFEASSKHPNVEFHLIGKSNDTFLNAITLNDNVKIHPPMTQLLLHQFLSHMDIGLALENKRTDGNRDICLTNKILAYAQAGLYIMATDTFGQREFLEGLNPIFGEILTSSVSEALIDFDKELINDQNKLKRWEDARSFSWEKQSEILMALMK
ncbi:MAG: hypothetical protein ABIO60_09300 [Aquaticitalea sp.]